MSDSLRDQVRKFVENVNSELKITAEESHQSTINERNKMLRETGKNNAYQGVWRAKYGTLKPKYLRNMSEFEKTLIESFYKNRPSGMHVDHIIPLSKGGKHRIFNLQYLPAALNISKKNRIPKRLLILKTSQWFFSIAIKFSFFRKKMLKSGK